MTSAYYEDLIKLTGGPRPINKHTRFRFLTYAQVQQEETRLHIAILGLPIQVELPCDEVTTKIPIRFP